MSLGGGDSHSGLTGISGGEDDAASITALYRAYRAPLMSFVLRLTGGDRQQAEDIVQETMVRAWREAARLDHSVPSLMPWLTAVARRIVIDEHRRRRARPAESGEGTRPDLPVDDDTADTVLRVAVADAMRELTSSHRQVLHETILRDQTAGRGRGGPRHPGRHGQVPGVLRAAGARGGARGTRTAALNGISPGRLRSRRR